MSYNTNDLSGNNAWLSSPVFINSSFYVLDHYNQVVLSSKNGSTWTSFGLPFNCTPIEVEKANNYLYVSCLPNLVNYLYNPENKTDPWIPTDIIDMDVSYLDLGMFVGTRKLLVVLELTFKFLIHLNSTSQRMESILKREML